MEPNGDKSNGDIWHNIVGLCLREGILLMRGDVSAFVDESGRFQHPDPASRYKPLCLCVKISVYW